LKNFYLLTNQNAVCDFCNKKITETKCIVILHELGEISMCKSCIKELYETSKLIKKERRRK
jgi:hypothetical protein